MFLRGWCNGSMKVGMILMSDQELVIIDLQAIARDDRLKALGVVSTNAGFLRGTDDDEDNLIVNENSPIGLYKSIGPIENVIKRVHSQIRTLRLALEASVAVRLDDGPCIYTYM